MGFKDLFAKLIEKIKSSGLREPKETQKNVQYKVLGEISE